MRFIWKPLQGTFSYFYLRITCLIISLKKAEEIFAAGKIIGGTDFQSSIKFIKQLNNSGLSVTVDHLGESVDSKEVTLERTAECIETIEMISREKLDSQVSLKMTSLGLDIDHKLVIENMTKILDTAEKT